MAFHAFSARMMRAYIILSMQLSDGAMIVSLSGFVERKQSKVVNPNFYYDLTLSGIEMLPWWCAVEHLYANASIVVCSKIPIC